MCTLIALQSFVISWLFKGGGLKFNCSQCWIVGVRVILLFRKK